jgi:hypothetical protein
MESEQSIFTKIWEVFRPYLVAIRNVFIEIGKGFRSYFVAITRDFLISGYIWLWLYLFKQLTSHLAVEGIAGDLIVNIHAAGAVGVYVLFAIMTVRDLFIIHQRENSNEK